MANADNGLFTQNIRVNSPGNIAGIYTGAVTEFGFPLNVSYTRPAVLAEPNDGCAPLTNGSQVNGNIAFVNSGACSPTTKARNAQAAGAVAAIISNNTAALPVHVRDDSTGSNITISSFLIAQNGGDAIRAELNGGQVVNISLTPGDVTPQAGLANNYASFNPYGGVYFSSRGPGDNNTLKPDITAPGINIGSAKVGSGNNYSFASGTSMAAPHVAGVTALLAQKYPNYTTRQIYDIVRSTGTGVFSGANSAPPERGPSLVGGGGVNAEAAITTPASVNYTPVITANQLYGEVIEATSAQTHPNEVTLIYLDDPIEATFTAVYDGLYSFPGANVTIPNPNGTVQPNTTAKLPFQLNVDPAALKRICAPWISPTQSGNARHCLPEVQGKVIFDLEPILRNPFAPNYYYLRPASRMGTAQTSINLAGQSGTFTIDLTGQGVNNGPMLPTDWRSFVSPFELQWIDKNDDLTPPELDYFDLQLVGIRKVGDRLLFGVSTHGDWRSHNELRFNVFLDINQDGRDDFHLFNTSIPNAQGAPSDVPVTRLFNINTGTFAAQTFFVNSFSPATLDSALYYTNVATLPVSEAAFGGPIAKFDYTVKTSFGNVVIDESARLTYANPGLDFGTSTMINDLPDGKIETRYGADEFHGNLSEGVFLQHHLNQRGNRAQILPANLGTEGDVAPRRGGNGSVTISDWVQIGRIVAGLDEANLGNEFQKADCAPRTTRGNGQLTVSDWVQAGRYAAGLDPVPGTGGPFIPTSGSSQFGPDQISARHTSRTGQMRTLRAVNASFTAGQVNALQIEVDAQGGENASVFTLNFDPQALSFVSAETGADAPGGTLLLLNDSQAAAGRIGLALALPAGQSLTAGTRRIARVNFNLAATSTAPITQISFSDDLIARGVANVNADEVAASYSSAEITLVRLAAHVSAASFSLTPLASESIVAAFGVALATRTEAAATVPLPTELAGTTVTIKDSADVERPGSLFFVSSGQVNYAIPAGTAPGQATITIRSGDGAVSIGNVMIEAVAPGLFAANSAGQGVAAAQVLRVRGDGTQVIESVAVFDAASGQFVAAPIDLGPPEEQVFLILYGTGMRFRSSLAVVQLMVGGTSLETLFLGDQGGFVGLDQLNARLARSLAGRGQVNIVLVVDGQQANVVKINIR